MSFLSAFPSSPLSRSALAAESAADPRKAAGAQSKPPKTYRTISSLLSPQPPHKSCFETVFDGDSDHHDDVVSSPMGLDISAPSAVASPRHVSGPVRLMHSPFVPSWSPDASFFDDGHAVSPPFYPASFTRSANSRRRSSVYSISASSSTPHFGSLVGSFQESLLSGRMSMPASKPLIFDAEIGVLGMGKCKPSLRCPPHLHVKFPAHFYDFHAIDAPASTPNLGSTAALGSPYVGTIDLEAHYHNQLLTRRLSALTTEMTSVNAEPFDVPSFPGYAVPPKGQIQLIVKYPDLNAVKLFLVPYDLTDMQPGTKTFVRQKTVVRPVPGANASPGDGGPPGSRSSPNNVRAPTKETLRFAIHLQFCCPPLRNTHDDSQAGFEGPSGRRFRRQNGSHKPNGKSAKSPRIYLHKSVRLVFGARALNSDEKLIDQVDTPGQGPHRFSEYHGPGEDWLQLHHDVKVAQAQINLNPIASTAISPNATGSSSIHLSGSKVGMDIRTCESSSRTSAVQGGAEGQEAPINSDPNGERWQGNVLSAQQTSGTVDGLGGIDPLYTSTWSMGSHESSYGEPAIGWRIHRPDLRQASEFSLRASGASSEASQPLRVAAQASSITQAMSGSDAAISTVPGLHYKLRSEASSPLQPGPEDGFSLASSSTAVARFVSGSHLPLPPAVPPSRIRSASLASICEARVQSVSAFGCLEESSAPASQSDPLSAELPVALARHRSAAGTNPVFSEKPSLLRKLSEQFARTHTPPPTESPKLRPARRQDGTGLEDKLAAMPLGDGIEDSCNDDHTKPIEEGHQQRVARFIR